MKEGIPTDKTDHLFDTDIENKKHTKTVREVQGSLTEFANLDKAPYNGNAWAEAAVKRYENSVNDKLK